MSIVNQVLKGATPVVEVTRAVKRFGLTTALNGLDLQVSAGSVHGFLGPNGAGKTTTLRALLGLIRLDAGQARLFGRDAWGDAADIHRNVAYVPGDVSLWPSLSGGQVIDLLSGIRGGVSPKRRAELLDAFDLDPRKKCRTYSKGNRQKVVLIAALVTDASLLLLDEPTSGLDPLMEQVFRAYVGEARDAGRTVLLSSHLLGQVQALCDTVSIVRAGRTVDSGRLADLRHLSGMTITADTTVPVDLTGVTGVHDLVHDATHVAFAVGPESLSLALQRLSDAGAINITSTARSLEELFLQHYRDDAPQSGVGSTEPATQL